MFKIEAAMSNRIIEDPEDIILPQKLVTVGVAQFSCVGFNLDASLNKLEKIVQDASTKGVQLLLFPEAYLPGYPFYADLGGVFGFDSSKGRKIYQLMYTSAVELPASDAVTTLCRIAKENGIFLVVGVIEKEATSTTMYCSVVFVSEKGEYMGKHRKLVLTKQERVLMAPGDGSMLPVFDTPVGKMGAVICWENYMPHLRSTMYTKGIQIYCAPNADGTPHKWQHTIRHIALEGRCFVLSCNQFAKRGDYPPESTYATGSSNDSPAHLGDDRVVALGGSMIVSPLGKVLAGPNNSSEELLVAEIDLNEIVRARYDMDVVGHYSRPDIFTLYVNERRNVGMVTKFEDLKIGGGSEARNDEKEKICSSVENGGKI